MEPLKTNHFNMDSFDFSTAEHVVSMAKTAELAERYEDMCCFMKKRVLEFPAPLDPEARNLLSIAYKNVIGGRRASWRMLHDPDNRDAKLDSKYAELYKKQVLKELVDICEDVLKLLEDKLIIKKGDFPADISDPDKVKERREEQVFYLKMAGDYYRYLQESNEDNEDYKSKCQMYYQDALDIAEKNLEPTHPIRLGLALNFSVCWYEILQQKEKACELAKRAFDDAISKLDDLEEEDYKDATLIMQLLRDNLTLWTQKGEGDEDEDDGA